MNRGPHRLSLAWHVICDERPGVKHTEPLGRLLMFRFNRGAAVCTTALLLIFVGTERAATAQTFTGSGRGIVNGPSNSGWSHAAWTRTSTGRLNLSHPRSAQGRLRLSQPTSPQGRLRLAPSADPFDRVRLQTPPPSRRVRSGQQERVQQFLQERIRQENAERARRQRIVERFFDQPAETTVMPLSSGKPQPTTLAPFKEVTSTTEDDNE